MELLLLCLEAITAPLLFLLICSYTNRARGHGYGKVGPMFLVGFCTAILSIFYWTNLLFCVIITLVVFIGLLIGVALGWGKYFSVFHGNVAISRDEKEVRWIDNLVNRIHPKIETEEDSIKRGFIGMTLRATYYYPLFIVLALFNYLAPLFGLSVFTKGLVYGSARYANKKEPVLYSELVYPWFSWGIGLVLTISTIQHFPGVLIQWIASTNLIGYLKSFSALVSQLLAGF